MEKNNGASKDFKAVVRSVDMAEDMQSAIIELALQAMKLFNMEKDIAAHIKKDLDQMYGQTWHCIVGKDFGSFVTYEKRHLFYFYIEDIAVLVFKTSN
ncbi:dynein light chain type 1-domain-containing protein [Dipodascopsis uninucleata]